MHKKNNKIRIDVLLVQSGFSDSRQKAQAEIMAGNVLIDDCPITKSGTLVAVDSVIRLRNQFPYVSRGALKLIHALDFFHIDVNGKIALDVGASTGGFTEVLLERGASRVIALDVGTNQLHWKLRSDERVTALENTNARELHKIQFDILPEIATIDVSFISLTRILEPLSKVLKDGFVIIALIKPQFELDKEYISKGGFVRPEHRKKAIQRVFDYADSIGLTYFDPVESPITGAKSGNVEFLTVFSKYTS